MIKETKCLLNKTFFDYFFNVFYNSQVTYRVLVYEEGMCCSYPSTSLLYYIA